MGVEGAVMEKTAEFLSIDSIADARFDERDYLKTGIEKLDKAIVGLGLGHLVIVTGPRAGGKTTLIGQIANNFVDRGYKGLIASFEMSNPRLKNWLELQALGPENLRGFTTSNGKELFYPRTADVKQSVETWLGKGLKIYNNASFKRGDISEAIAKEVEKMPDLKFVIIDNLMKIEFDGMADSKWEAQSQIVKRLQRYAQEHHICMILVAHPNKVKTLPRIEDVGGSGDIINAADTVLLMHRVTKDFKKRADEAFGWKEGNPAFEYSNIIEVAKDREFGADDTMVGVYFDPRSKRFLNYPGEEIRYGWEVSPTQEKIAIGEVTLTELRDDEEAPF